MYMCTHVQALIQITVCEFLNTCDIDWLMPKMILITVSVWESDVQSGGYTCALPNSYVRICVTMAYYYIIYVYVCDIRRQPFSFPSLLGVPTSSLVLPLPPRCSHSIPLSPRVPLFSSVTSRPVPTWRWRPLPFWMSCLFIMEGQCSTHTSQTLHLWALFMHTHSRTNAFMHAQWQWYRRGW